LFWTKYTCLLTNFFLFQELIDGFDQEAAAAVVARLVSFKMETEVLPRYLS
jgi:hypothetical protein